MLLNERGLNSKSCSRIVNECVAAAEEGRNHLVQVNVSIGSQIGFLDTLKQNLENMQFDTQGQTDAVAGSRCRPDRHRSLARAGSLPDVPVGRGQADDDVSVGLHRVAVHAGAKDNDSQNGL